MNDILETVQHKIDKLEERLPGVMDWEPNPIFNFDLFKRRCVVEGGGYSLVYDEKDAEYRERLIWDLTAELLYWYGMQQTLEAL